MLICFSFDLDPVVLMTTLYKGLAHLCIYVNCSLLNICQYKKCFEQMLWRKYNTNSVPKKFFCTSYGFEIIQQK